MLVLTAPHPARHDQDLDEIPSWHLVVKSDLEVNMQETPT
jgi:hypothetical protein